MRNFLLTFLVSLLAVPAFASVVGVEFEEYATSEYGTTHRVYVTFDSPDDELVAIYGTVGEAQNAPLSFLTTTSFYNTSLGANYAQDINVAFIAVFPEIEFDSWFTIGSENSSGSGGVSSVGLDSYLQDFNNGDGFTVNTFTGASWFIIPGSSADAIAGDDNKVLVAQLTSTGVVSVVLNVQYDDVTGETFAVNGLTSTFPEVASGCTDATACNYDTEAVADDGSCYFTLDPCDDSDGNTINDAYDSDCQCTGEPVVLGCMSSNACNYSAEANSDDGTCFFVGDACDDGDSTTGGDVVGEDCNCAGMEIVMGCTDNSACNYEEAAEASDGSCVYPGDACDDGFGNTVNDQYQSDCSCEGELVPTGPCGLRGGGICNVRIWNYLPSLCHF